MSGKAKLTFSDGKETTIFEVDFGSVLSMIKVLSLIKLGSINESFKLVEIEGDGKAAKILREQLEKKKTEGANWKPDYSKLVGEYMR